MPYLLTANPGSPTSWVKMETESVFSGNSENSSRGLKVSNRIGRTLPSLPKSSGSYSNYSIPPGHGHRIPPELNTNNLLNNVQNNQTLPDLTSVQAGSPCNVTLPLMSPLMSNYSLSKNINHLNLNLMPRTNGFSSSSSHHHFNKLESPLYQTTVTLPDHHTGGFHYRKDPNSERIEVQILPQDNDWADNATTMTGMSDLVYPPEASGGLLGGLSKWSPDESLFQESGWRFLCQRYGGSWISLLLSFGAFFSPILMVVLPQSGALGFRESQLRCEVECDGALIGFAFKLLVLLLGSWALFLRSPRATLPRIYLYRACVSLLVFIFVFSFWLFYGVRVLETQKRRRIQYYDIVLYANSMVDSLLFVHYLALILLEIKHLSPQYYIKIIRSPDGESRCYPVGHLSIQRCAAWILEKYYTDFPVFNPYLERLPIFHHKSSSEGESSSSPQSSGGGYIPGKKGFRYFDGDVLSTIPEKDYNIHYGTTKKESHNERFYEEYEYERRLKKRKARLITATEEAFEHLKAIQYDPKDPTSPLDSHEAAQAIFPSISRPLQKYLRITRQQPWHSMESILQHLSTSLKFEMSPKAFLEKYIITRPVLQNEREEKPIQTWALICEILLSRSIGPGTIFQLRQGDVSLLCQVSSLPHFNITEEVLESPGRSTFLVKVNSETPV